MTEQPIPHNLQRRENLIEAAHINIKGNHTFPELGPEAKKDTLRVRRLLRSTGRSLSEEVRELSPGEQSSFVRELADRSRNFTEQERQATLLLGRLLKNETIPLSAVNADGTFDTAKLASESYFQENPHVIHVLNLSKRRLSEKSKTRQKALQRKHEDVLESSVEHTHSHPITHAAANDEQRTHEGESHPHECNHQHAERPTVMTVMRNEVKTLGKIGNWWDRQRALRRTQKGRTPNEDAHLRVMQDVIAEEIPDVKVTMSKRQRRRFSRLTEEQQATVTVHVADLKAERALKPSLPRWWKNGAIGGNLGVGIAELFAGRVDKIASDESVTALIYDGGHNALDAITYGGQADNVTNREITEQKREKRRRFIYQLICAGSILAAAKSGYHLQEDFFGPDSDFQQNYHALIAGSASLTLNTILGTSMYRNFRREKRLGLRSDEHKQDLVDHMKFDFAYAISAFSAGLFASKNLQIPIEDIISGAVSVFSAIRYRPTEKNLANAHTHNHDHEHTTLPVRHIPKVTRSRETRRMPRKLATGTAALVGIPLVFGGGFTTAKMMGSDEVSPSKTKSAITRIDDRAKTTNTLQPSTPERTPSKDTADRTSPTNLAILFDKQEIQKGDTFWDIGKKQLSKVKPKTNWANPENGVTRNDVIIDFARDIQTLSGVDLDKIFPGGTMSLTENIDHEDLALIKEILTTTSYDEYKKIMLEKN